MFANEIAGMPCSEQKYLIHSMKINSAILKNDALLYGLLSKDAKQVCKITRVSEMWTTFEREKTKRDFANSIRVRAKLFGSKYVKGMDIEKYLESLEDCRRQL
ncbi:hypothetical protein PHMEG_00029950 [Phytophthora megakarya]|uniref:Uncharacterized protein n=1 Tax=Phytophthora megakarya TaxID=4795 RepID=A0A225V0Y7_9STRA|nr:hypothetical protein PHMEG_00029950 [Phytophthora megakarya]